MKKPFVILIILFSFIGNAQQNVNTNKKGYAADGYDVVAYFENIAVEGNSSFETVIEGVKYKFSNKKNLDVFLTNSSKYIPQYGGWCAYAIGAKNEKVEINPKTFEIRAGSLYLFYNAWGTNTLKLWKKEGAEKLKKQADENWNNY